jgi:hypothetical protein
MKIWRRCRDIPQTWHAQDFRLWRRQRTKYAVSLKQVSSDTYALMARDAPERFEQSVGRITGKPAIKPAAGRYERSFEAGDGVQHVPDVWTAAIDDGELPADARVSVKLLEDLGEAGAHNSGIFQ